MLMGAAVSVMVFAVGVKAQDRNSNDNGWQHDDHNQWSNDNSAPHDNPWPYAATGKSPVLAVVGDISCQPGKEVSGESGSEVCDDPSAKKGNYTTLTSSPAGPPFSLWQSQEATATQIENMHPAAVALLGDLQYQVGNYSDFMGSFNLTYGAFKYLHRPAPGNHEFYDEHGQTGVAGYGYFSYYNGFNTDGSGNPIQTTVSDPCPSSVPYFGGSSPCSYPGSSTPLLQPVPRADGQAGHFEATGEPTSTMENPIGRGDGWYSYDIGAWHLISLNIECSTQQVGGCPALGAEPAPGTWLADELTWLKKDLEENHSACTLAYWHQPTFSATNSISPEGIAADLFWRLLYDHRADLVLNGHDHLYARYRHLDPNGTHDPERGIREFIVGTGGETLDPIVKATVASGSGETNLEDPTGNTSFNADNLEAYSGDYWGVMALTLDPNGYHWDFESAPLPSPTASFLVSGVLMNNGPTSPAAVLNGATGLYTFSDKGFGTCHGSDNR
jgi:hypothetical protein